MLLGVRGLLLPTPVPLSPYKERAHSIMLFFLVPFLPFMLLIANKPRLPSWVGEMRLLSALLLLESVYHSVRWVKSHRPVGSLILKSSEAMEDERAAAAAADEAGMNVLALPELALELILEKLPPAGLIRMSSVCSSLRERCRGDHLWERHFMEKWGRLTGPAASRGWEAHLASAMGCKRSGVGRRPGWLYEALLCAWPCSWFLSKRVGACEAESDFSADDSVMAWYLALESGRLWFPAQVYNREQNGHVGFMLSCYHAEVSYDSHSDTFHARYAPHGQRATNIEEGVKWDRLRAPPVETPAHDLHASDCLHDLRPGDHIEIQWRRNKEFPYGWWYGVVGHLESCGGDEHRCRCFTRDTVVLEFNQYSPGSRWRRTVIDRKDHREEGNESDGFYGGIRKLCDKHEISTWRWLWPTEILE